MSLQDYGAHKPSPNTDAETRAEQLGGRRVGFLCRFADVNNEA